MKADFFAKKVTDHNNIVYMVKIVLNSIKEHKKSLKVHVQ